MVARDGDCPSSRSRVITGGGGARSSSSAASSSAIAETDAASHVSIQAPAHAPSFDLDSLLFERDSIDAFCDEPVSPAFHHHQQHHHQHHQHLAVSGTSSSNTSNFLSPRALAATRDTNLRSEVTAVQAFLEEWRDEDDAIESPPLVATVRDATPTTLVVSPVRMRRKPSKGKHRGDRVAAVSGARSARAGPARSQRGDSEMATPPTAVHTIRKPKTVGTREREKEEAVQLRVQALQLEQQLQQLRQCVQGTSSDSSTPPLWKRLAERQQQRLLLVRSDNQSLKAAVREHKQMAKSLHRVLLNRIAQATTMQPRFKALAPWHEVGESPDDQHVFAQLLSNTTAMYMHTDRVERAMRAKIPPHGKFRKWDVKQGASAPYIELIDVEELPFSISQINNLIHTFCSHITTTRVQVGGGKSTVLMVKEEHRFGKSERVPRMRSVFQNFVEPSRSVFLYCSLLDVVSAEDSRALPGQILQERKWIILTDRPPAVPTAAGPHKTAMVTYSTIAPLTSHPLSQGKLWTRESIEASQIPMWDRGYSLLAQKIENDLLELAATSQ